MSPTLFLTFKQSDPFFLCKNESEIIRDEVSNWFGKKMILKAKWHCAVRPQSLYLTPCCRVQTGNIVYKNSSSFFAACPN